MREVKREEIGMETYLYGPMDYVKALKLQFRVGDLWNVLEMWKIDECDTEFVDNSEKTIAILPDR